MSLGSLSQQSIELVFDHPVTLADRPFQLLTIEDLDMTAGYEANRVQAYSLLSFLWNHSDHLKSIAKQPKELTMLHDMS